MKKRKLLKICPVVLVIALLMSTIFSAFAETTKPKATDTTDKWVTKAPMSTPRCDFQTVVINGKIYAIGGNGKGNTLSSVEEYDPVTDKWTSKASMSSPRSQFQTEVVNGKIYAIGGIVGNSRLNSVEEYDPVADKWIAKKPMSTARCDFQTAVVNGKIYAIGGESGYGAISTVEMYDPATDTWTPKTSMNYERDLFQTAVINGKIYAIGGQCPFYGSLSCYAISSVEEYDPVTNIWTKKASMLTPRHDFKTQVIDGKIFAIGGLQFCVGSYNYISQVEEYNPVADKWIANKSMSTPRYDLQTAVINGKIFAIGGGSNKGILSSSEMYDLATDTWISKASMNYERYKFQIAVINGKIYAIGDSDANRGSSVEEYTATQSPTLTVTPSADKVKINDQFSTTVAIHKGTNICAEDIKLTYDTNLFDYVGSEAKTGLKIMKEDSTTTPGTIRFIVSSLGKENAATGDKDLITLKFKAKKPGKGKVDIIKGRIADNATLEMDVADADCGEATITVESNKDVNRSGEVTLLDLGIDGWYYGSDAKDTDSTKYDADVIPNGKIDGDDLSEITQGILSNSKYPNN